MKIHKIENLLKIEADEVRERLQNIQLRQFFGLLKLWADGVPYDPFKMLERFLAKGLPITAAAKGYVGDGCVFTGDVDCALRRVRRACERGRGYDGFDADAPWASIMVKIHGEKSGYKKSPGRFFIGDVCRVPCDHIPRRSYPLFRARDILRGWLDQQQRGRG